jgi:hypothetical protein
MQNLTLTQALLLIRRAMASNMNVAGSKTVFASRIEVKTFSTGDTPLGGPLTKKVFNTSGKLEAIHRSSLFAQERAIRNLNSTHV